MFWSTSPVISWGSRVDTEQKTWVATKRTGKRATTLGENNNGSVRLYLGMMQAALQIEQKLSYMN